MEYTLINPTKKRVIRSFNNIPLAEIDENLFEKIKSVCIDVSDEKILKINTTFEAFEQFIKLITDKSLVSTDKSLVSTDKSLVPAVKGQDIYLLFKIMNYLNVKEECILKYFNSYKFNFELIYIFMKKYFPKYTECLKKAYIGDLDEKMFAGISIGNIPVEQLKELMEINQEKFNKYKEDRNKLVNNIKGLVNKYKVTRYHTGGGRYINCVDEKFHQLITKLI